SPTRIVKRPAESIEADAREDDTLPSWLRDTQRSPTRIVKRPAESIEADEAETLEDLTPPSWLRILERAPRPPADVRFEESEAFTFDPTAQLTDFSPDLRKAWHSGIEKLFQRKIARATKIIKDGLKVSEAEAADYVRFFSPASRPSSITLTDA